MVVSTFIATLMEKGVPFVACDMPNATPFMLHIHAAVAEEEVRAISVRTKEALAAAKARGTELGGWRSKPKLAAAEARGARPGPKPDPTAARQAQRVRADEFAAPLLPLIRERRQAGASLRAIAAEMTSSGKPTPRGGAWTAAAVNAVLARA